MNLKEYYDVKGPYLQEHKDYFSKKQLKKEVDFLVDVLSLSKKDKILDLACGHGRHTIELKKRGYNVGGLDFSGHLLKLAEENAKRENLQINFYKQDIHNFNLKIKYNKIFLFFSEFGLFDAGRSIKNVSRILKRGGLFLLDCDNTFRLIQYLIKHPKTPYKFDFEKMEFKEKKNNSQGIKYYTVPGLRELFINNKLNIISVYGNYEKEKLDFDSGRIVVIGKKIK